jgi:hypothetical protein
MAVIGALKKTPRKRHPIALIIGALMARSAFLSKVLVI